MFFSSYCPTKILLKQARENTDYDDICQTRKYYEYGVINGSFGLWISCMIRGSPYNNEFAGISVQ